MRIFVLLAMLALAVAASAQVPPVIRNDLTTNANPAARAIVTNVVNAALLSNNAARLTVLDFGALGTNTIAAQPFDAPDGKRFHILSGVGGNANRDRAYATNGVLQFNLLAPGAVTNGGVVGVHFTMTNTAENVRFMAARYWSSNRMQAVGSGNNQTLTFILSDESLTADGAVFGNAGSGFNRGTHVAFTGLSGGGTLLTNGLANSVDLGSLSIPQPNQALDASGAEHTAALVWLGNNRLMMYCDGYTRTVSNVWVDLLRPQPGQPAYLSWELSSSSTNVDIITAITEISYGNLSGWEAWRSQHEPQFDTLSPTNRTEFSGLRAPIHAREWRLSNAYPVLQHDSAGRFTFNQHYGDVTSLTPDANSTYNFFGDRDNTHYTLALNALTTTFPVGIRVNQGASPRWVISVPPNDTRWQYYSAAVGPTVSILQSGPLESLLGFRLAGDAFLTNGLDVTGAATLRGGVQVISLNGSNGLQLTATGSVNRLTSYIPASGSNAPLHLSAKPDGSAQLVLATNGNVGMGTNNPGAMLDVPGLVNVSRLITAGAPDNSGNSVGTKELNVGVTGTIRGQWANGGSATINSNALYTIANNSSLDGSTSISFGSIANGTAQIRTNLVVPGNVGIGTNAPAAKLQVTADNSVANVVQFGTTNSPSLFVMNANGNVSVSGTITNGGIYGNTGSDLVIQAASAQSLLLKANGGANNTISFGGSTFNMASANLGTLGSGGFGVSAPNSSLHVVGGLTFNGITNVTYTASSYTNTVRNLTLYHGVATISTGRTNWLASNLATNGTRLYIKDRGTATGTNLVVTPTTGTIDGAASYTINANYAAILTEFDGTNWWVLSKY